MTDLPVDVREVRQGRSYTEDHLWVLLEEDQATVGVTPYGVELLGEVVYFDLPDKGTELLAGEPFGTIESVKIVYELSAPVGGEVLASNDRVLDEPGMVEKAAYDAAWLVRLRQNGDLMADLLSPEQYSAMIATDD